MLTIHIQAGHSSWVWKLKNAASASKELPNPMIESQCVMRYLHLIDCWRQHRCILWYPTTLCVEISFRMYFHAHTLTSKSLPEKLLNTTSVRLPLKKQTKKWHKWHQDEQMMTASFNIYATCIIRYKSSMCDARTCVWGMPKSVSTPQHVKLRSSRWKSPSIPSHHQQLRLNDWHELSAPAGNESHTIFMNYSAEGEIWKCQFTLIMLQLVWSECFSP